MKNDSYFMAQAIAEAQKKALMKVGSHRGSFSG